MIAQQFSSIASLLLATVSISNAADRPNILLIVADDVGYSDLGCYGGTGLPARKFDSLRRTRATRFVHRRVFRCSLVEMAD